VTAPQPTPDSLFSARLPTGFTTVATVKVRATGTAIDQGILMRTTDGGIVIRSDWYRPKGSPIVGYDSTDFEWTLNEAGSSEDWTMWGSR
jgi:hypothetical protein